MCFHPVVYVVLIGRNESGRLFSFQQGPANAAAAVVSPPRPAHVNFANKRPGEVSGTDKYTMTSLN